MRTSLVAFILAASLAPWTACDPEVETDGLAAAPRDGEADEAMCDDPDRAYVSYEPELCRQILFLCQDDMTLFNDGCGCGCVATETPTPPLPDDEILAAP